MNAGLAMRTVTRSANPPARAAGPVPKLLLALVAVAVGCGMDDRPPVWEYISLAVFQPNCATVSCHSRATAVAGLDFSDPERGYTSLTGLWTWIVDPRGTTADNCRPMQGTVVCQKNVRPLVTPYDPAQSRVINMLRARDAPRMPPDRPLSEVDIRLVETWILNGARRSMRDAAAGDTAGTGDGSYGDGAAAANDGRDGVSGENTPVDAGTATPNGAPNDGGGVDVGVTDGSHPN